MVGGAMTGPGAPVLRHATGGRLRPGPHSAWTSGGAGAGCGHASRGSGSATSAGPPGSPRRRMGDSPGFLVAFVSPDHGDIAQVHLIGGRPQSPAGRHRPGALRTRYRHPATGRRQRDRSGRRPQTTGSRSPSTGRSDSRSTTVTGRRPWIGTPATADYDGDGEDRVRLTRTIMIERVRQPMSPRMARGVSCSWSSRPNRSDPVRSADRSSQRASSASPSA